MAKNNKETKKNAPSPVASNPVLSKSMVVTDPAWMINDSESWLWILSSLVFIGTYIHSFLHTSLYQGEEISQYLNMRNFWDDPSIILGQWPKTGWKLFYVIPSLMGAKFVTFLNCLMCGLCCYFILKTARLLGVKHLYTIPLLFLCQPLYLILSSKNYSEPFAALVFSIALYAHYSQKNSVTALCLSLLSITRLEFSILAAAYGAYMLYNKRWIPMVLLSVFPLLYSIWGYFARGSFLFLIDESQSITKSYNELYPRQGFDHYFKMALPIYGALAIMGLILYLAEVISRKRKVDYFILLPFLYIFLIYCMFNWQSVPIGPANGGNLRYVISASPFLVLLGGLGITEKWKESINWIAVGLATFALLYYTKVGSYAHNWVGYNIKVHNWLPIINILAVSALLLLPLSRPLKYYAFILAFLLTIVLVVRPHQLKGDENAAFKEMALWLEKDGLIKNNIYSSINVIPYYVDKSKLKVVDGLSKANIESAPSGSIIIWDTHFGQKYSDVKQEDIQKYAGTFKMVRQILSDDKYVQIIVLQKP
jgi:hypothetical protein